MLNLSERRKSKNLTQDELAAELGVTRSAVAMWESGKSHPRAEKLVRLAKLFDCRVDDLLSSVSTVDTPYQESPGGARR